MFYQALQEGEERLDFELFFLSSMEIFRNNFFLYFHLNFLSHRFFIINIIFILNPISLNLYLQIL